MWRIKSKAMLSRLSVYCRCAYVIIIDAPRGKSHATPADDVRKNLGEYFTTQWLWEPIFFDKLLPLHWPIIPLPISWCTITICGKYFAYLLRLLFQSVLHLSLRKNVGVPKIARRSSLRKVLWTVREDHTWNCTPYLSELFKYYVSLNCKLDRHNYIRGFY